MSYGNVAGLEGLLAGCRPVLVFNTCQELWQQSGRHQLTSEITDMLLIIELAMWVQSLRRRRLLDSV